MRVPRRQPRAVYEVYDAADALSEQEGEEQGAQDDWPSTPGLERAVSPRSARRVLGRALAGAMLCATAVCVVAAISIVLLHLTGGSGSAHPRSSRRGAVPSRRKTDGDPQGASPDAASPAAAVAERSDPSTPASATRPHSRRAAAPTRAPLIAAAVGAPRSDVAQVLPSALTVALPGCACAAAEAEFGFER